MKNYPLLFIIFVLAIGSLSAQDIELLTQFNGHYDYTAIGNTLNLQENESVVDCEIYTTASANLTLTPGQNITAAYLYWAGSGPGDFDVTLNGQAITASRTFAYVLNNYNYGDYFAAYADVTSLVSNTGNANYTLSDLDLTADIADYCSTGTNFGGWAIIIVYEDASLPLNQVSIYDGLQGVSINNNELTISLDNLNVIDNIGAKIGFLAWEGDNTLAVDETLQINGNAVSNPPLNPVDNAFNGTNSFTGSSDLYNMDLDFYNIENKINVGDTSAQILLTSGNGVNNSDFVMVNNIVTVLNSELPEPTSKIDQVTTTCGSLTISIDYTVHNDNATAALPADTPILFYANNNLIGQTSTVNIIPISGAESGQLVISLPNSIPDNFTLKMLVNKDQNGDTVNPEIDETNNEDSVAVEFAAIEIANPLLDLTVCDDLSNDGSTVFDLTANGDLAIGNQQNVEATYYSSQDDAENENDPIPNPGSFENTEVPQFIYVRVTSEIDPDCYEIGEFLIDVYFSPTANAVNDLTICDDFTNDSFATIDLTQQSDAIIDNQPQTSVSYFTSEEDAETNQNAIDEPQNFQNTENPQTIYARVENSQHPECYDLTQFQVFIEAVSITPLGELRNCNEGFNSAIFDLTEIKTEFNLSSEEEITGYYTSGAQASAQTEPIPDPTEFSSTQNPQQLFIRVENPSEESCYDLYTFSVKVRNCPPVVPQGFSPNGDGINDTFYIPGLYDIFENFHLKIFSRYGNLIYEGDNQTQAWDGHSNRGLTAKGNQMPSGTYYYVLFLNDPDYNRIKGWVYLNR